ncbi:protein GAMETOPHYTE DEFECTIVE 1-like [Syzygium oleosum]|uniref:protein GAMETOPHYTE DEFECTIVE 1-like n=1 Tax=Syzygium oleosum TaxID=219896 RepID=UPI0024B9D963|nr:protein GAMETOPHYTE DEFECTIVE 1-like [Syzygium oleosum]
MEVGYDGVTYNRSMSGSRVQSRPLLHPLLSLSALLKDPTLLSSSVSLHHSLLSLPLPLAFRRYTRLTVFAETVSQAQVQNSANPVLKSYDLVTVRPFDQAVFDHVSEKSEVDEWQPPDCCIILY